MDGKGGLKNHPCPRTNYAVPARKPASVKARRKEPHRMPGCACSTALMSRPPPVPRWVCHDSCCSLQRVALGTRNLSFQKYVHPGRGTQATWSCSTSVKPASRSFGIVSVRKDRTHSIQFLSRLVGRDIA